MRLRAALLVPCFVLVAGSALADWGWPTAPTPADQGGIAKDQDPPPPPPGSFNDAESDPRAVKLIRKLEHAMGGRHAWLRTRHVSWDFFGQRQHLWDRFTDNVRIESADTTWLMNLQTRDGRVWKNNVELQGAELRAALDEGLAAFRDDGYWMLMPWKLREPGVVLKNAGVGVSSHGRPSDKVAVTFHDAGAAPAGKYVIWLDRGTHLVNRWSWYSAPTDAEPKYTGPWKGWTWCQYAQFSGDRGMDKRMDPATWNWIPRSAYESPAPWAMPGKVEDLGSRRATPAK